MTRLFTLLALLLAVGALTVAGCGDDEESDSAGGGTTTAEQGGAETGGGGTDTGGGAKGEPVKIDMKNIEYVPKQATAEVGQKIDWTNGDSVAHTVTSKSGAKFDSGNMDPGDDFSFTPTKAGKIDYFCEIHPNQTGSITVTQ